MSTKAKATLASSIAFCAASVVGVHYIQNTEKEVKTYNVDNEEELNAFL